MLFTYMINQQMHDYKSVQSHVIILHEHVLVAPVTIVRVSYKKKQLIRNSSTKMYDKSSQYYT
jgi:hypothetical protein